ncbi:MAG: cytochrome c maturation protein CcmE [Acidimicrobiales bacterium]
MTVADERLELTPVDAPGKPRRRRRRVVVALAVLAACALALVGLGLARNLNYFETVDQALGHRSALGVTTFRLEGVVRPHTIERTATGAAFVLAGVDGRVVHVSSHGTPPQLFQANIPVVVVGHFSTPTSRLFVGHQILVKHTASYIAQHPSRVRAPNGTAR